MGSNTVPDRDSSSSVIYATPLNQVAPSTSEATNDDNSDVPLQSESVPELEINHVPSVTEVSSTSVIEPSLAEPQPPANRWTRRFPIYQVIRKYTVIQTRRQLGNICLFVNFVSLHEPKKIDEALPDPFWVTAMQEEFTEFERNKVWKLFLDLLTRLL